MQELAAELLGFKQLSLGDQIGDGNERAGHILKSLELRLHLHGLPLVSLPSQYVELAAPACLQCRIESTGSRVRLQRGIGAAHVPVVVAFFLVRTTMFRYEGLQFRENLERRVELAPVTSADGSHVKRFRDYPDRHE